MKRFILSLLLLVAGVAAAAQTVWYNPMESEYGVVQNQAFSDEIKGYARLPKRAQGVVRNDVWNLAQHSAGLAIYFHTDSPAIEVRFTTTSKNYAMPHMPATGVSGVDLYRIDTNGNWAYCAAKYSFNDEVCYKYTEIDRPAPSHDGVYEYRLYLPLYNGVKSMQIGVNEGCKFEFVARSEAKPIVAYGTSIAQGGCVSRPAMMWSTIVQRAVGVPMVNLGFSGNGRLESEVLDFIGEIDASLYILDCIPNLVNHGGDFVYKATVDAIKQLRAAHKAPILLVEHIGFTDDKVNQRHFDNVAETNAATRRAFEQLKKEGYEGLYYLSRKEIAVSYESTVDGTHLTDYGMVQQAEAVEKIVRKILKIKGKL